jgi:hypothetical protein
VTETQLQPFGLQEHTHGLLGLQEQTHGLLGLHEHTHDVAVPGTQLQTHDTPAGNGVPQGNV